MLACAFVIIGARWPGPVRRIAEALGAWTPVSLVLFLIGFLGGRKYLYEWIDHPIAVKTPYLNEGRLLLIDFLILLALALLSLQFLKTSVRPTLHGAADSASGLARTLFERWTANWKGEAAEREESEREAAPARAGDLPALRVRLQLHRVRPGDVARAHLVLEPVRRLLRLGRLPLGGVGDDACSACSTANYPGLEGEITRSRLHDLGKMIFAFSIFWMYLFFSQYLVIWYGNLPEETSFIRDRLGSQFLQDTWHFAGFWSRIWGEPWVKVTLAAWICVWVIPFWCLLGQEPKKTWWFVGTIAGISAFGFWLERNVLIWPSLVPGNTWAWLGWIQIGIALGFLGAFALVYLTFTRVFPSLAVPRQA